MTDIAVRSAVQRPQRARGAATLSVKSTPQGTALARLRQAGSLKLLFPRGAPGRKQAVLVNTAGGITGGDRFTLNATAGPGTHLTLTTQAAERAYAAMQGETGHLANALCIGQGARLDWVPQETILFEASTLSRRTTIDMAPDARLLFVEPILFGRRAMGETVRDARFHDRLEVRRDGAPLFLDAMRLEGDLAALLGRENIAGGAAAIASVLYVAPDAAGHVDSLRALLPPAAGLSLIRDDVVFLRLLAPDGFALRQTLCPILTRLSGDDLPRPWMI